MDILNALAAAITNQDCDQLRDAVNMVNQDFSAAPLLAHVLLEEWHDSHEDIVFELGLIGNPSVVGAIASAAQTEFQTLVEWGNLREFQRKCAYALARIGTDESRTALEDMVRSEDDYIQQVGLEGLSHWPMPYKTQ